MYKYSLSLLLLLHLFPPNRLNFGTHIFPPMSIADEPPAAASNVDFSVWRSVAGLLAEVVPVNSLAYYFPQGHLENCSIGGPVVLDRCHGLRRSFFLCRVLSRRFLCHPASDELFVVYVLQPEEDARGGQVGEEGRSESDMVIAAKVLTPSDANNGGGFTVPRSSAELIFPPLDFEKKPSVQTLAMRDLHNRVWEFRHIHRGTPRRHLLTSWANFCNAKRLIAGDSIVFMRKISTGELLVGIRRARRRGGNNDWVCAEGSSSGFTREPMEAMGNAANGLVFEVAYYPRIGLPNFVVSKEKVSNAMSINWSQGMLIKMARESEDSTHVSRFDGVVTGVTQLDAGPWRDSPWGILQVDWGIHGGDPLLNNIRSVNPWDVEYVPSSIPSYKKRKLWENPGIVTDGAGTGEILGRVAQHMDIPPFPAVMQGTRQDESHVPPVHYYQSHSAIQTFIQLLGNDLQPGLVTSSTLESTGILLPGNSSLGYQNDPHLTKGDSNNHEGQSSHVRQDTQKPFQLFGNIIHVCKLDEGSANNASNTDDESKEVSKEREATGIPPQCSPQRSSSETIDIFK